MSLEGFSLDRFDDTDLWRQSRTLISELPGLHVRQVFKPVEHPDDMWTTAARLSIENDLPVTVQPGETVFRGSGEQVFRMYCQAQAAMESPWKDRGTPQARALKPRQ